MPNKGASETDTSANPNARLQAVIGVRARRRREELRLSLREVAARMGVSASFLSLLERGLVSPSLNSLRSAAAALEVPIAHFLPADSGAEAVIRKAARPRFTFAGSSLEYELLVPDRDRKMALISVYLAPGESTFGSAGRSSEECILVLEGQLSVDTGVETHALYEGDSIYLASADLRRITAEGQRPARYLSASTPPAL